MKPSVIDYLKVIEDEKDLAEHLAPFDEIIAEPEGTSTKGFAMIKGSSISELYDIIRNNPNTHYRFCCEDYVHKSTKEEFNSLMFSAIIRKSRSDTDFAKSELIGSRICELFSVDCPFVAPMGKSNKIVASVDFLRFSQEMQTYADYTGIMYGKKATAYYWARRLENALNKDTEHDLTEEKKKLLIKDLIKHYLVRRFLLQDNDFNCGNLALVSGSDRDLNLVSFDFEFCLNNYIMINRSHDIPADFMRMNIEGLAQKYPEELDMAIEEIKLTPERLNAASEIYSRFLDPAMAKFWTYSLSRNSRELSALHQECRPEKEVVYEQ